MKRRVIIKKAIAVAVTMSLMTCLVPNGSITVNAASKKSMLSKTKISVNVGKKKTVKLKKAKYKVVWKIISGKKNISIKKKGKYKQKIQIKGKKIGKAKIKIHTDFNIPNTIDVWGYGNYGGLAYVSEGSINMESK